MQRRFFLGLMATLPVAPLESAPVSMGCTLKKQRQSGKIVNFARAYGSGGVQFIDCFIVANPIDPFTRFELTGFTKIQKTG